MPNRLAEETSPYLQQHRDNPVDWWPWCDAAFEEAKRRDVPVFVSIGYATCHWCHVMAHESFEDEEVARRMNEAFVNIKVDREERPDVDDVYMQVCQAMTGHGGWPLNVALTPAREPWFAGTYFPKASGPTRMGMLDLVPALRKAWDEKREDVAKQARHLVDHLSRPPAEAGDVPAEQSLWAGYEALKGAFDARHGGFGRAPKFPSLHQVRFLLRMHMRGAKDALPMAERTLDAMACGGIRDHVGGGFHRYSTDARWHLPHFEKMLYDQGMALLAFGEAYMLTGKDLYREVLEATAAYLEREMRHESGVFFAAEDADAEGEEGRFTTWPWDELMEVLVGDEELARALGAAPEGNYHDEATGEPSGRNILHAADVEALKGPLAKRWQDAKSALLARRDERVRPLRDEKVLTDWNGLAVAGLAAAGRALGDEGMLALARGALGGLREVHGLADGGALHHSWCDGQAGAPAFLEDIAALGLGQAMLAAAAMDPDLAAAAADTLEAVSDREAPNGAYYRTPGDTGLPARPIDAYDGAVPSGNALLAEADLLASRLLSGDEPARTRQVLAAFSRSIQQHPTAHTASLAVLDDLLAPYAEVIVHEPETGPLTGLVRKRAHPRIHPLRADAGHPRLLEARPYLSFDGDQAFVCRHGACELPAKTADELGAALERILGEGRQAATET